jgi:hypothetical protein
MPFGSSYVDNRRSGSLYDADGNVLLDHGSNRTHIYDAASRQVQTREQSDSSSWGLGLGASQSTSSSSSPSPSPSASPSPAVGEPDAPQPNAPIDGYYTTTTLTIAESYDGDGRSLKRVQTKVQSRPFYQEVTHEIVDYYLRSTVLGGQVITELTSGGQKQKTNVYIGSEVAAEQVPNGESQFMVWKYQNPVTGTSAEQTSFVAKKEYDPSGLELGDSDPYLQSEFPDYPGLPGGSFYGEGGNPFDGSSGCQWDGMPVPCHVYEFAINSGYINNPDQQRGFRRSGEMTPFNRFDNAAEYGDYVDTWKTPLWVGRASRAERGPGEGHFAHVQQNAANINLSTDCAKMRERLMGDPNTASAIEAAWTKSQATAEHPKREEGGLFGKVSGTGSTIDSVFVRQGNAQGSLEGFVKWSLKKIHDNRGAATYEFWYHTHPHEPGEIVAGEGQAINPEFPTGERGDIGVSIDLNLPGILITKKHVTVFDKNGFINCYFDR